MNQDLREARAELQHAQRTFVLVKNGETLGYGGGPGVGELLSLAARLGDEARGAALADRVVGRAAAFLALKMELSAVYAVLLSEGARALLMAAGVGAEHETLVPAILNRSRSGPCPMESLVSEARDPEEAIRLLGSARNRAGEARP